MNNNNFIVGIVDGVKNFYNVTVVDLAPHVTYNPLIKINNEIEKIFKENFNNEELKNIIELTDCYNILAKNETKGRKKRTKEEINEINAFIEIITYNYCKLCKIYFSNDM